MFSVEIHLNDHLKKCIEDAKSSYKKVCDNLDVNYTIFEGIGKDTCKKSQVSPDAIMQLAFQVCIFAFLWRRKKNYYVLVIHRHNNFIISGDS